MKQRSVLFLAALALCLGPYAFTAAGQTSNVGSISVTVLDPAAASIPNASLELKDLGTNDVRRGATSAAGTYTFPSLNFGQYQLTFSAQGFQSHFFESVQVQTGRTTSI